MSPYKHSLGDKVALIASSEPGEVVGRAEYQSTEPQYLVRYVAATGEQRREWIPEEDLRAN